MTPNALGAAGRNGRHAAAAEDVGSVRHELEMIDTNTGAVTAKMVDFHAAGDRAINELPGGAMGHRRARASESAIAVRAAIAGPDDAITLGHDLRREPYFGRRITEDAAHGDIVTHWMVANGYAVVYP